MNKIKIVIADDHQLFRSGIVSMLQKEDAFEMVGDAANGQELLTLLEQQEVDVVLVDLSMPQMNGLK